MANREWLMANGGLWPMAYWSWPILERKVPPRKAVNVEEIDLSIVWAVRKAWISRRAAGIVFWIPGGMPQSRIISERAFEFACRIVKLCDRLYRGGPSARHIAYELLKSGTSIGANSEEAEGGQTKADFIAKLSVSRKEARESRFWLRLAIATSITSRQEVEWELSEANQLLAMIIAAIKTAQSSNSRGES
jgi:four helix bundle protein